MLKKDASKKTKANQKKQKTDQEELELVLDPEKNWVFSSETELYDFFEKDIAHLESKFDKHLKEAKKIKKQTLEFTLDDPDEIWERTDIFEDERPVHTFIKTHNNGIEVALCHTYEKEPVLIYTHFTLDKKADLEDFRYEYIIKDLFNKEVFKGAIPGDSLYEGEELSVGLYKAMMTLRIPEDYPEEEFSRFAEVREITIEEADEVWRSMDSYGNYLVYFIKDFEDTEEQDEEFTYIVITQEDENSDSNVLLFSFPTKDPSLVQRYRVGENMQAEVVSQEESH